MSPYAHLCGSIRQNVPWAREEPSGWFWDGSFGEGAGAVGGRGRRWGRGGRRGCRGPWGPSCFAYPPRTVDCVLGEVRYPVVRKTSSSQAVSSVLHSGAGGGLV